MSSATSANYPSLSSSMSSIYSNDSWGAANLTNGSNLTETNCHQSYDVNGPNYQTNRNSRPQPNVMSAAASLSASECFICCNQKQVAK